MDAKRERGVRQLAWMHNDEASWALDHCILRGLLVLVVLLYVYGVTQVFLQAIVYKVLVPPRTIQLIVYRLDSGKGTKCLGPRTLRDKIRPA